MQWRRKAQIQRLCSRLPAGNALYYKLQRHFGSLRQNPDPVRLLRECSTLVSELRNAGHEVAGARVMEVGTGRRIDMPLGLYLAGATGIVTVDLNRYLRPELVMASVRAMHARSKEIMALFDSVCPRAEVEARFERLTSCQSLAEVFAATNISYLAPADAQHIELPSDSVDIQISYTVFEHIPRNVLVGILREASRLLGKRGVALHHVDLSDHYAHDDPSISYINFLQFSQAEWNRLAGNRFAYHNRLRGDDYRGIYAEAGHDVLAWQEFQDQRSLDLLDHGFPLDPAYRAMAPQQITTCVIRILSR
jgi:Methyltransferase domain